MMSDDERRDPDDTFYVGYAERAPEAHRRFLRPRIAMLLVFAALVLGVVSARQQPFAPSLFEFGVEREFVGWLEPEPVPRLVSLRPGNTAHCGLVSSYPLVALGKFGAGEAVGELAGRAVRLRGTLIHREGNTMIEVAADGIVPVDAPPPRLSHRTEARVESLGRHRFEGEIVDSKCDFGVMNPGSGKVHRACAARCISGGIPPAFRVRDEAGASVTMLLVDERGRSVGDRVMAVVGRPVAITGEVLRYDDLLVLHAPVASIERLPSR